MVKKSFFLSSLFFIFTPAFTNSTTDYSYLTNLITTSTSDSTQSLKSKYNFDSYEFIVDMFTNQNSNTSNYFSKINISLKPLYRELIFAAAGVAIGTFSTLQLSKFKLPASTKLNYFLVPAIVTYLLLSFEYQYHQKSKINLQRLQQFVKNWKYYKQVTPTELYEIFDNLYEQYLKNGNTLNLSEAESQNIVAQILKTCICGTNKPKAYALGYPKAAALSALRQEVEV